MSSLLLAGDTIAAIATADGLGAVSLLRVSGPEAPSILTRLAPELKGRLPAPRRLELVRLRDPADGSLLDRALVAYFPAPASYTGEPVVEITTHGGRLTPRLVLAALLNLGAREARPGEFSFRAVLNGKMDVAQAEAIGELIEAWSPAFRDAALHQAERGLSGRIEGLRDSLLTLEALLSYGIDFPEEDEPPVPPAHILSETGATISKVDRMLETAPEGGRLRHGALVVMAGAPNAGKSSLFNALLGVDRSIVTATPGTTRDAVESEVTLLGYPFRIVDTAGLREALDEAEMLGIEIARRYHSSADIVVFCHDGRSELSDEERQFLRSLESRALVVATKIDLLADAAGPSNAEVEVSVIDGRGLARLREILVQRAFGSVRRGRDAEPIVFLARHLTALRSARQSLVTFREAFENGEPWEFAATHLADARSSLEAIIGVVTTDDLLTVVFSRFCIGK